MRRDLAMLSATSFDLVIVGGGLFGAFAAWDAAQRGLAVALLERGDFGGATSAHSFKMVHGGIRYLQHADLFRVRQSSNERRALLRIAPHLVRPLPIAIPTEGRGMSGRAALRAGLLAYDVLTLDRNRLLSDSSRRLPASRMLSREDTLTLFPDLVSGRSVTGAGVFADGQYTNPPRLVLAVVQSAVAAGAAAANYVEVTEVMRRNGCAVGVRVRDHLEGNEFEVRATTVVNAAGPYAEALLQRSGLRLDPPRTYSRDACFVVPRKLVPDDLAVAILGQTRDPDARVSRGARHLFLSPWRDYTLVGVWHRVQRPGSLDITVTEDDLTGFLAEINRAAPALALTLADVSTWNAGLVPFGENPEGAEDLRYGHRSSLIDHATCDGCQQLITLIGLRLTTARYEAERAVNLVFRKQGRRPPPCRTAETPVVGGDIDDWDGLVRAAERETAGILAPAVAQSLVAHQGAHYRDVLGELGDQPTSPVAGSRTIRAQVYRAARSEMAYRLEDVVLRRTDLGTGAYPGTAALAECADILAGEFGWSEAETSRQIASVTARYPAWERDRVDGPGKVRGHQERAIRASNSAS